MEEEGINVEGLSNSELFELERKLAKEKNTKNSNKNKRGIQVEKSKTEADGLGTSQFEMPKNVELPQLSEPQLEKKVADLFAANAKDKPSLVHIIFHYF